MIKQEMLKNIMTDAVEGCYTESWADIKNVKRDNGDNVISFDVKDFEDAEGSWYTINEKNLAEAIEKIRNGEVKIGKEFADQFSGEPEDWYYDAIGADCAVQIAAFNEIIFG